MEIGYPILTILVAYVSYNLGLSEGWVKAISSFIKEK